jgi:molybdopterin-guanine dinucleotide biosynthesis protein A
VKYPGVSALILAGGKARRLGGMAKHAIVIDGKTIFERQVAVLKPLVADIMVSAPAPIDEAYCTLPDTIEDAGPLGGIASGLCACMTPWMLVVAGDMPYLSPAVIELLCARAEGDAVAFEIDGRPQPLLCALKQETFETVNAAFQAGERKASRVLTDLGLAVTWIHEPELRLIDPALRSFANVNTPADLQG